MFDRLLNLLVQATSAQPSYAPEHCLVVTKSVGGCSTCADVCPHEAITIGRQVEINDVDCTGCGVCVQACPSQALSAKVSYQPGAPLRCSRVGGSAQSVLCLARLQPSDVLRLASRRDTVTLARNDCSSCKIGDASVPERVEGLLGRARELAAVRGRTLHTEVRVETRFDAADHPDALSRRELLRGGVRSTQRAGAELLAPLEALGKADADASPGKGAKSVPLELSRHYRLLEAAEPAPEAPVPWVLPRVAEGCIMCPVCTNVCPTGAFERSLQPVAQGGGGVLTLEPERCNGCNACVRSCPVKVITLDSDVRWGEVSGGAQEVYRKAGGGTGAVAR